MAGVDRSAKLFLYSVEDKSDDNYIFSVQNAQAQVDVASAAKLKFDAPSYEFVEAGVAYDLESRFDALESDTGVATNAAAIVVLQAADATEQTARISGDASLQASIDAEVVARTAAVAAVQADVDANEVTAAAASAAVAADLVTEISDRVAGVAAEAARAQAAEAALSSQIASIISNADPASLDSLSELLAAYQAADSSLGDSITAAVARIATLEQRMDALVLP